MATKRKQKDRCKKCNEVKNESQLRKYGINEYVCVECIEFYEPLITEGIK